MDLLNLPNRTQIYEFYMNLKILEIFTFLGTVLKFGDLFGVWTLAIYAKFQHNIFKMLPRLRKHMDMGCECLYIFIMPEYIRIIWLT